MVERDGPLSLSRQCELLAIGRASLYREPAGESAANLALMRRIDELYLDCSFYGSRRMSLHLRREGVVAGRHRVRRLMRLMGVDAVHPKPRTSAPNAEHEPRRPVHHRHQIQEASAHRDVGDVRAPDLVRALHGDAAQQIRVHPVLSWRLSNTMDAAFCVEALGDALGGGAAPGIFNTDQGAQFTSLAFTGRVLASGARCSMDGRGRCMDNVFIERLWRSLKYEAVYLRDLADGFEAERAIDGWMRFYNGSRPHLSLAGRTPAEAYGGAFAEAA